MVESRFARADVFRYRLKETIETSFAVDRRRFTLVLWHGGRMVVESADEQRQHFRTLCVPFLVKFDEKQPI